MRGTMKGTKVTCRNHHQCSNSTDGETCIMPPEGKEGVCGCPSTRPVLVSVGGFRRCYPGREIFQSCLVTEQCQRSNPYLACSVNVCACLPPRVLKFRTECTPRSELGGPCLEPDDCGDLYADCIERICCCTPGFEQMGKLCVHPGTAGWKKALVLFVPAALSLLLLLLLLWLFCSLRFRPTRYEKLGNDNMPQLCLQRSVSDTQVNRSASVSVIMETTPHDVAQTSISRSERSHTITPYAILHFANENITDNRGLSKDEVEPFLRPTLSSNEVYSRYPHLRQASVQHHFVPEPGSISCKRHSVDYRIRYVSEESESEYHERSSHRFHDSKPSVSQHIETLLKMPVQCRIIVEPRSVASKAKSTNPQSHVFEL
ncbi:uncharacterized protein LOC135399843 [Ornithodoros turicata]|uniref:uncharacterized protein LOC135399843 n=1 Tax=Ornithodoros turicata TaxID=34597 RepID=UPI00313A30C3